MADDLQGKAPSCLLNMRYTSSVIRYSTHCKCPLFLATDSQSGTSQYAFASVRKYGTVCITTVKDEAHKS